MPRKAAPIPPIRAELKDLGLAEVRVIIEAAEREEMRRIELTAELRVALERNDIPQIVTVARKICGLEEAA
jgi:hypothetical protein